VSRAIQEIDPIRLELIRNRLTAAANEMAVTVQRAAYSTNIKTRLDFSCALFDPAVRVIAQSFSQPNHLGSLAHFVPRIVEEYGIERLRPGDGLLCNDGHRGGVHLNDICLVSPVFYEGKLVAFVAAIAHHVDVGGGTPGSLVGLSKEIYQEGLRIPSVRLFAEGQIDDNIFRMITNNIRSPKETAGDLRAQVAGVRRGIRQFTEIMERYGPEVMTQAIEEILNYTERQVKDEIAKIPKGVYKAEGFMDSDGLTDIPIKVCVTITVGEGKVIFDLTGSDAQRPCPINATYAMSFSNCAYTLRALMEADVLVNGGFYRAIEVIAPPGSIVNAQHPAAVGGGWETAFRVLETCFQAFATAIPERLTAGSKGCLCNIALGGKSRKPGEFFVFYEAMGGGYGARATKDGIDAVQAHAQNTENSPVEETEVNYPLLITKYALITDSEGAGRFRGGLGLRRDYAFEDPVTFSVLADRAKFPPWGLEGGSTARAAHYVLNPDTNPQEFPSKFSLSLQPTDIFSVQMGGGGGYGSPLLRDPSLVLEDLLAEKITPERAKQVYGVVIDAARARVDEKATVALRAQMQQQVNSSTKEAL
jgi:N-methylhydantoinase B